MFSAGVLGSLVNGASPFVQGGGMNPNDPWGSYNKNYGAAAQTNQNLFSMWQQGTAQQMAQAQASLAANQKQYANLQRATQRQLAGSNRANIQDIADQYTAMSGRMSQQMIDRGLGNTTVQQSMQRGVASDFAQERTRSNNQFAQLRAGFFRDIGLDRLRANQSGIGMMAGLHGDALRGLMSISAPYPDPGAYAALAASQSGGMGSMMPGLPGPSPSLGPVGGYQPAGLFTPSYGMDFGGGGGGMGGWATGYANGGGWNVAAGQGYDNLIPPAAAAIAGGAYGNLMGGLYGGGGDF